MPNLERIEAKLDAIGARLNETVTVDTLDAKLGAIGARLNETITVDTLDAKLGALRRKMATKAGISKLRREMATKAELRELRGELRQEMANKADISELRSHLGDLRQRLGGVQHGLEDHDRKSRLDRLELYSTLREEIHERFVQRAPPDDR